MTISDPTAVVNATIACAQRGWRVLPVHGIRNGRCTCGRPSCEHPGKHPRLRDWPKLATTDRDVIRRWWLWWPAANVGIATDGGLLVFDVDGEVGAESLHALERQHGALPETPHSLTGGGGHHYLFSVDGVVGNKVAVAPGLDIRGNGGFIVAPPSLHASGRRYVWESQGHPDDVRLAPAPQWLLELIGTSTRRSPGTGDELRLVPGERNDRLFRLACGWRRRGIGAAALLDMLRAVNAHHVDPPLAPRELAVIVESVVARYTPAADDRDLLLARALGLTA